MDRFAVQSFGPHGSDKNGPKIDLGQTDNRTDVS